MMNETKLIGTFFKPRQKAIAKYATQAEAIQDKVLRQLLHRAEGTEWGLKHDYRSIKGYQDFQARVIYFYSIRTLHGFNHATLKNLCDSFLY